MPFPGTGCQSCKLRRVKCDGARPVCRRCVRSRRICSWVGAGLHIHLENCYASGKHNRPRGPRSAPIAEVVYNPGPLLKHPSVDLKSCATMYYRHNHVCTPTYVLNISKSILDDLLPKWTSMADYPILDLAIASTALAVFGQTQKYSPAVMEASTQYHQLLRLTQDTISSLDQGNIEACLLAVFLMGRYENTVHCPSHLYSTRPFTTAIRCFSHHDGSLAILKVWKDRMSQHQPATDVIKHTRRSLIKSALLRGLAIPEWMLEGTSFGEHGLELEYDRLVVKLTNIRQRLSVLRKERAGQQRALHELNSAAEELNKEAADIDDALQNWTAQFPSAWCHRQHTLSSWPTRDFYCPTVYSYSSPAYAGVWIQYYSIRMLASSTQLRILEAIRPNPGDYQRLECLSQLKSMADNLASRLPFWLQRFKVTESPHCSPQLDFITLNTNQDLRPYDANLAVWPLTIASSIDDLDMTQRSWFRFQLARFGCVLGDQVLQIDEASQWLQI